MDDWLQRDVQGMDSEVLIWSTFKCRRALDLVSRSRQGPNSRRAVFLKKQLQVMKAEMERRQLVQRVEHS